MGQLALLLLIVTYFAFASARFVLTLRRWQQNRAQAVLLAATLLVPYLLVVQPNATPATWEGIARMAIYILLPTLVLLCRPARSNPLDLYDLVAIIALWFPIEFDWLPEASVVVSGVGLPIPKLTAICLGFFLFLVLRPLDRLGYSYKLGLGDVKYALIALAGFAIIGMPLGIAMGFIQPGFTDFNPIDWLVKFIAIYFVTAVPEELLFRGVIQNLIEQRLGRNWLALGIAAIIFGISHLNNTTAHHAPPNLPYVIMATIAGLAYGWAWRKSEKITASAITHTLVNFVWGVVFKS